MLGILDRYLLKELAPPFAISVAVFSFFMVIDRIYQLTDLVITKGVPLHLVLALVALMMPSFLSLVLPMAMLVATLVACGRLAGDLEITAVKASGVSLLRLFRPVALAAVLVSGVAASLTLFLTPWAHDAFQRQLFRILQTRVVSALEERVFNSTFNQIAIYVDEISPSQVALRRILVSDERDPKVSRVIVAREGRLLADEAFRNITLRFIDGSMSETDVGDLKRFRYTIFTLYDMTLPLETSLAKAPRFDKPERDLPLPGLLRRIRELATGPPLLAAPYWVELHKRFALPVAVLVFVIVAFPLGIRHHRGGRSAALSLSLALVVGYYVLFTTFEGLALRGRVPAGLALWTPNAVFAAVGVMLLLAGHIGLPHAWSHAYWRAANRLADLAGPALALVRDRRSSRVSRGRRASTFIMDRYVLRQYVSYLGIGLGVAVVLILVVDLLQTLDRFLRIKPPAGHIVEHFLYVLPPALYMGFPLVVLIATVFLFLSLTRHHELDALKAAGISLQRTSVPVLLAGIGLGVAALAFQETLLPEIKARSEVVDRVKIRGQLPRHLERQNRIWYRSSDLRFLRTEVMDPLARTLDGVTVLDLDANFRLVERLDVRSARWTPEGWRLADGFERQIGPGNQVRTAPIGRALVQMPENIDDLIQLQRQPTAMTYLELRTYVQKLQESGHRIGQYLVDLYAKLAWPLVYPIVVLVAIPFALASPRHGGRAVAIGVAIAIAVGYWVVQSVAVAFARADLLPPMLAAWTANIVFAGIGTALYLRART